MTASVVTDNTALPCGARKIGVSGGQADTHACSALLGDIPCFCFAFGDITWCGSASLKLCVCNAASPWSQSTSPDSHCGRHDNFSRRDLEGPQRVDVYTL